jgi:hypothetical protein
MNALARYALKVSQSRPPDVVIGGKDSPYLLRWYVIPRNPFFNIYAHEFRRSDDDRALHTHPWLFNCSQILLGSYWEHCDGWAYLRRQGSQVFRWGASPHRVQLIEFQGQPTYCRTLFITGPRVREWGFLCPQGFRRWQDFTASHDKGSIGRGCE